MLIILPRQFINNQTIANITNGFYGYALEYKGDFMPGNEDPGTIFNFDEYSSEILKSS